MAGHARGRQAAWGTIAVAATLVTFGAATSANRPSDQTLDGAESSRRSTPDADGLSGRAGPDDARSRLPLPTGTRLPGISRGGLGPLLPETGDPTTGIGASGTSGGPAAPDGTAGAGPGSGSDRSDAPPVALGPTRAPQDEGAEGPAEIPGEQATHEGSPEVTDEPGNDRPTVVDGERPAPPADEPSTTPDVPAPSDEAAAGPAPVEPAAAEPEPSAPEPSAPEPSAPEPSAAEPSVPDPIPPAPSQSPAEQPAPEASVAPAPVPAAPAPSPAPDAPSVPAPTPSEPPAADPAPAAEAPSDPPVAAPEADTATASTGPVDRTEPTAATTPTEAGASTTARAVPGCALGVGLDGLLPGGAGAAPGGRHRAPGPAVGPGGRPVLPETLLQLATQAVGRG